MQTPKITKGTWIRTIVLAVTVINGALLMFGKQALPLGEAEIENAVNSVYAVISAVGLIVAAVAAWWKNNDFSTLARNRKKYLK